MTLLRGDWFYIILLAIDAFFMTRPYLYVIQQDNYRTTMIFKSRRLAFVYVMDLCATALFVGIWLICYFLAARAFWGFATVLFFFIAELAMYFTEELPTRKKPLKYTKRAVRCLLFVTLFVTAAVTCLFAFANTRVDSKYLRYIALLTFPTQFPALFFVGASIENVFEKLNNSRYIRRTKRILAARDDLIKIAVTGSFGKTSVKNFLHAMLAQKYNVLSTPASYNTPMGIAKTVNGLDPSHDVFIAEFGARRKGDIRELMKIVKPKFTLLTGINSQHLETFGSQENITREKCRILDVGEDGICVVNGALKGEVETRMQNKKHMPKTVFTGYDGYAAENVVQTDDGTRFDLILNGERHFVQTPLIGKHNVENVLLAATMAYEMGVEIPFIIAAIEELEAPPHRMQLIRGNGIKIIDDSFNSNPDGARRALDTLAMFDCRKVALTPGLVELGERETEENYELGKYMANIADLVLLVGVKHTDPIRRGLVDGGYGGEIHIYRSLADAEDDFANRLNVGDALLILNDLPDIYEDMYSNRKKRSKSTL